MPNRNVPQQPPEASAATHTYKAFPGALDGASAVPSPVAPEDVAARTGNVQPKVYFHRDRFVAAGGSYSVPLTYLPIAYSEHVYLHLAGTRSQGMYQREGKAWKRESGKTALQVLSAMNARSGDVIEVLYAYYSQQASGTAFCGNFAYFTPDATGSLLSQLGPPMSGAANSPTCTSTHLKVRINGNGSGSFGAGDVSDSRSAGIKYDPTGSGNFSSDVDFLSPGAPYETYYFDLQEIDSAGYQPDWKIGGENNGASFDTADVWTLTTNRHYLVKVGSSAKGWVVCQYLIEGNTICINMRYTNTTSKTWYVRAMRGLDPDQDKYFPVFSQGSYSTNNYVGLDGKSRNTNAAAIGPKSKLRVDLDASPGTYRTSAHVCANWSNDARHILDSSGVVDTFYSDYTICVAWDIGYVAPGRSAVVNCSYTFSQT